MLPNGENAHITVETLSGGKVSLMLRQLSFQNHCVTNLQYGYSSGILFPPLKVMEWRKREDGCPTPTGNSFGEGVSN